MLQTKTQKVGEGCCLVIGLKNPVQMPFGYIRFGRDLLTGEGLKVMVLHIGNGVSQVHQIALCPGILLFFILSGQINGKLHKPRAEHGLVALELEGILFDHASDNR